MHRTVVAALLLAALAATVAAQKDKAEKKAKGYKTPQEVFDAFVSAQVNKDCKTYAACLALESQKDFAVLLATIAVEKRRSARDEKNEDTRALLAELAKATSEVLDKHGLSEKATKDVKYGGSAKEKKQVSKMLDELIKKPEAFLAEMLAASDGLRSGKRAEGTKLTGVKIDGDKAVGVAVNKYEGKEYKEAITFVKVGGGWRILLPNEDEEKESKDKTAKDKK
jgi:hypothetical protein